MSAASSLKRVMSLGRLSRRWTNKQRVVGCETLDVDDKATGTPRLVNHLLVKRSDLRASPTNECWRLTFGICTHFTALNKDMAR